MGVSYGPSIVSDSLKFVIDAGNTRCFTPGNTSCVNIITEGAVTGASGQPNAGTHTPNTANFPAYNAINGGVFDFAGGRGMNIDEDLNISGAMTIDVWYYKNNSATQYLFDGRNQNGNWFLVNYQSKNINFHNNFQYNFDTTYNATNPDFINRWQHLCITSDATGPKLYIDGTERTNIAVNNNVVEDIRTNFRIGTRFSTSTEWTGYMGPIKMYSRVLTEREVRKNFVAHRARFGV